MLGVLQERLKRPIGRSGPTGAASRNAAAAGTHCPFMVYKVLTHMATLTVQEAMDQGLKAHQAGNLAEAEALYQQVLEQTPDNASALHLSGVVAYQGGKYAV